MARNPNSEKSRFDKALKYAEAAQATGTENDPLLGMYYQGLAAGSEQTSGKSAGLLDNFLTKSAILAKFGHRDLDDWPEYPESESVAVGVDAASGRVLRVRHIALTAHLMGIGASRSGKTTFLFRIANELLKSGVRLEVEDHKSEGRRLMNLHQDIGIFGPTDEPSNILEPVGDEETYWFDTFSEIGRAFNLRPENWTQLPDVMKRLQEGMKPGEAYPSLVDFYRILMKLAEEEKRPSYATSARAIRALCRIFGKRSRVRRAPDIESRYQILIREYGGVPPRIHRLLAALRLSRSQLEASVKGHTHNLKKIHIRDEAGIVFGKEMSSVSGSGYIPPQKRDISQIGATGTGVFAGVQILSEIEDSLKSNVSTLACFRTPNPKDVREVEEMFGLSSEEAADIPSLVKGTCYIRTEGYRARKVLMPDFPLGPYPSDDEVRERMADEFAWIESHTEYAPEDALSLGKSLSYKEILGEVEVDDDEGDFTTIDIRDEHRVFAAELLAHPSASIVEHYANLGWSAGRGTRIKTHLLDNGMLEAHRQTSPNGRPVELLVLSEKGMRFFHDHT